MYHLKSSQLDGPVDDEQEGGDGPTGENYLAGFFEPGVAPHAAVQAVDLVADQGHDYHDEEEEGEVPAVRRWGDVAPEEHLRSAVAGQDADGVQHHEEDLCPHAAEREPGSDARGCRQTGSAARPRLRRAPARRDRPRVLSSRHPDHRRRSEHRQSHQSVALRPRPHVAPT